MLETFDSAETLADAAARAIADALVGALRTRGRGVLVATGGRSPGPVYNRLRGSAVDWARVTVTLSDERCVAPDAPESNGRAVRERLLIGPAEGGRFLPLWPDPGPAALEALLPFDVVMLGMGEDGHVASLIPGDPDLGMGLATDRLTQIVPAGLGNPPVARITLTLSALCQSRAIFLLIAGEAKRQVLGRALAGEDLPVGRLIRQAKAPIRTMWAPHHLADAK